MKTEKCLCCKVTFDTPTMAARTEIFGKRQGNPNAYICLDCKSKIKAENKKNKHLFNKEFARKR